MEDAEIVDGLRRGDTRSQLALLDRYQARLVEFLLRRFQKMDEKGAEDIAAYTLERLVLDPSIIDLAKGGGSLTGLVKQMAKNRAIDLYRKRERALGDARVVSLDLYSDDAWPLEDDDQIVDKRPGIGGGRRESFPPEVVLEAQQLIEDLNLSKAQLEHLRLRWEEKLQPAEIAEYFGITPNNERVRWHRLRKAIERKRVQYPHLAECEKEMGFTSPGEGDG